jgi:hypothetical protein
MKAKEIYFIIEDSIEGGFEAKAIGYPIYTEGETVSETKENIKDAINCHFDENEKPSIINIRYVKEEIITL